MNNITIQQEKSNVPEGKLFAKKVRFTLKSCQAVLFFLTNTTTMEVNYDLCDRHIQTETGL